MVELTVLQRTEKWILPSPSIDFGRQTITTITCRLRSLERFSTWPHRSSSYFHVIISLLRTYLDIDILTPALPKLIPWSSFHRKILFILFCLIKSILSYIHPVLSHFFHNFTSTFISRFTIPFTLTYLSQIRFTNPISPTLLHCACIVSTILICILFQSNTFSDI